MFVFFFFYFFFYKINLHKIKWNKDKQRFQNKKPIGYEQYVLKASIRFIGIYPPPFHACTHSCEFALNLYGCMVDVKSRSYANVIIYLKSWMLKKVILAQVHNQFLKQ